MTIIRSGVTRTVILTSRFALKLAWGRVGLLRGWLANRSEWVQRHRVDVNGPLLTVGYFVSVFRRADEVGDWDPEDGVVDDGSYSAEESKGSSWGRFGDEWLLIDFDRAWQPPRGLVGGIYYGRQERMARRWAELP